jgi:hypothetical protein
MPCAFFAQSPMLSCRSNAFSADAAAVPATDDAVEATRLPVPGYWDPMSAPSICPIGTCGT